MTLRLDRLHTNLLRGKRDYSLPEGARVWAVYLSGVALVPERQVHLFADRIELADDPIADLPDGLEIDVQWTPK